MRFIAIFPGRDCDRQASRSRSTRERENERESHDRGWTGTELEPRLSQNEVAIDLSFASPARGNAYANARGVKQRRVGLSDRGAQPRKAPRPGVLAREGGEEGEGKQQTAAEEAKVAGREKERSRGRAGGEGTAGSAGRGSESEGSELLIM